MKVRVEFEDKRVGRKHDVEPQTYTIDSPVEISALVYEFVRPMLISRDVDVVVSPTHSHTWTGIVETGFHVAARFSVTEVKE